MTMIWRRGRKWIGTLVLERITRDRRAVTALEYGLLTGLIALLIVGAVTLLGTNASTMFSTVSTTL